jgi:hypothetical protein
VALYADIHAYDHLLQHLMPKYYLSTTFAIAKQNEYDQAGCN